MPILFDIVLFLLLLLLTILSFISVDILGIRNILISIYDIEKSFIPSDLLNAIGKYHSFKEIIYFAFIFVQFGILSILLNNLFNRQWNQIGKIIQTFFVHKKFMQIFVNIVLLFIIVNSFILPINYLHNNYKQYSTMPELILVICLTINFIFLTIKSLSKKKNNDHTFLFDDEPLEEITEESSEFFYVKQLETTISLIDKNRNYFSVLLNGKWGSGKTSILNTLGKRLKNKNEYEVLWINAWKLKDHTKIIKELEMGILNFLKKSIITIPDDFYNYFEWLVNATDNTLIKDISKSFNIFIKKNNIEIDRESINELIFIALRHQNKKKLVVIFDDIDRVIDSQECISLLKTIRYITGFQNVVSISGMDVNIVNKVISSVMNEADSSFIYKIFNTVIEINTEGNQNEIVKFLKEEWNRIKEYLNNKNTMFEIADKDKEEIIKMLDSLIDNGELYDLFHSYREVKLTFNDFFQTILKMTKLTENAHIIDLIIPRDIFLMSALKNINVEFYFDFLYHMKKELDHPLDNAEYAGTKNEIIKYLKDLLLKPRDNEIFMLKNAKSNRIFKIFELIGFELVPNDKVGIKDKRLVIDDLSILNKNSILYYINPILRKYEFSNKMINEHINKIKELQETDCIDATMSLFKLKIVLFNSLPGSREHKVLIMNYFEKIYNTIVGGNEHDFKDFDLIKKVILGTLHYISEGKIKFDRDSDDFMSKLLWQPRSFYSTDWASIYINSSFIKEIFPVYQVDPKYYKSDSHKVNEIIKMIFYYDSKFTKVQIDEVISLTIKYFEETENREIKSILLLFLYELIGITINDEKRKLEQEKINYCLNFILNNKFSFTYSTWNEYQGSYLRLSHDVILSLCRLLNGYFKKDVEHCIDETNLFESLNSAYEYFVNIYSEIPENYKTYPQNFTDLLIISIDAVYNLKHKQLISSFDEYYRLIDNIYLKFNKIHKLLFEDEIRKQNYTEVIPSDLIKSLNKKEITLEQIIDNLKKYKPVTINLENNLVITEVKMTPIIKEEKMAQQNLVSFQLPESDMAEVTAAIATLKAKLLPNLKTLSADERHEMPKMGDKTVPFVQKALEYCKSNADIVPPFLDVDAFKTDVNAVVSIRSIFQPLSQITDALNDTMLLSGSEAYAGALILYNAAKSAAKSNISGAKNVYDDLSARFPGRPKGTPANAAATQAK